MIYIYILYQWNICIYDDTYIYIWLINLDDISSYIQHGGPRLLQIISFQHDVCPRFPGGFGVILATPRHASLHSSPKIARQRGWKKPLKSWHKKTRRTSLPMMDDVAWCWLMCFFNPNFKTAAWHTHTHKMWFCEVKFNLVILFSKRYPDPQVCRLFLHWFSVLRFLDNFPTWDTVLRWRWSHGFGMVLRWQDLDGPTEITQEITRLEYMGVSKNRGGPPKWMVYNGNPY